MGIRDVIMTVLGYICIPIALTDAFRGLMAYCWLSFMKPQSLVWTTGTREARFTFFVAIVLILRAVATPGPRFRIKGPSRAFVAFWIWMIVSLFAAPHFEMTKEFVIKFSKIGIAVMLITGLVRTRSQFKMLAIMLAACPGLYAFRLGTFLLRTGGLTTHGGPIGLDNNDTALFIAVGMPMLAFCVVEVTHVWGRRTLLGLAFLSVPAVIAGGSRGGLLAMSAAGALTLWRKTSWLHVVIVVLIAVPVVVALTPSEQMARYETLKTHEEDASAQGRLWAWETAMNMANDHPWTGIGLSMGAFRKEYNKYKTRPKDEPHVAHSVWFSTLAGMGYIGLGLYIWLLVSVFRTTWAVKRMAKQFPGDTGRWAKQYAIMIETAVIAFCIGATFLSQVGFEYIYAIFMLTVPLHTITQSELKAVKLPTGEDLDAELLPRESTRRRPRRMRQPRLMPGRAAR